VWRDNLKIKKTKIIFVPVAAVSRFTHADDAWRSELYDRQRGSAQRRQRQLRARRFLDSKTVGRRRRHCIGNMMDGRYKSTGRYKRKRRARNCSADTDRVCIYLYIHIHIQYIVGRLLLLLLPSFHFSSWVLESVSSSLSPSSTSDCYP